MDVTSRLVRRRNRVLAAAAGTFLIWQGAKLALDLGPEDAAWIGAAGAAETAGALAWAAATLAFLMYAGQVSRHKAGAVMNDEGARHDQARAMAGAYKVLVVALGAVFLSNMFVEIDAAAALRGLIIVAVVAPISLFLWFSREGGAEA